MPEPRNEVELSSAKTRKLVALGDLVAITGAARAHGRTVALCHGCFDLVHIGHVHHLHAASRLADVVVVSVSKDPVCAKGPGRPAFGVQDRMRLLAAFEVVDHVCMSPERTAVAVIEAVRPDVFVKGPDYRYDELTTNPDLWAEAMAAERCGARVHYTDAGRTSSSTRLLSTYGVPGQPATAPPPTAEDTPEERR